LAAVICCWCEWLETTWPIVYEEDAFVVLGPGSERCRRNNLTLVPKTHASLLTDLPPRAMADVLAGLSKLSLAVRTTCGWDEVEITTHPADISGQGGHVHFHPVLTGHPQAVPAGSPGEQEVGERVVLAIADAIAHPRARLRLEEPI
jgi:diadenosine tetraphosphate (Ap4A) HIT family hydrolase